MAQFHDVLPGQALAGHQTGHEQIEHARAVVHDAAGQPDHRDIVEKGQQKHGPGKGGRAVGHHPAAGRPDGGRGLVVGIDGHAAGDGDQFHALDESACKVSLRLEFEPQNRLLGPALSLGMQGLADRMVDDFVREADKGGA